MFLLAGVVVVALGIFVFNYQPKAALPLVSADGKIDGEYAVEGVMQLGKPYVCKFERADATSKVTGLLHINEGKMYGEFRIKTDLVKDEFNSFLVLNKQAYTWTSLGNLGYKSAIAKSATKNASSEQQSQIIGTRDLTAYKCEPWTEADDSVFEPPSWITFTELKD